MYNRIEIELQGVQSALQSSRAVSFVPLPEGTTEEGIKPVQLFKIANTVEVHLRKSWEEIVQATQALKQAQEEFLEQCQATQQDKDTLQEKFEQDREKIKKQKEKLLTK
jgi:hypothetical protein